MADAQDLKSWGLKKPCGFKSHHRHHLDYGQYNQGFGECQLVADGVGITVSHNVAKIVQVCFDGHEV